MRNLSAVASGVGLAAVAVYALVSGYEAGAAVFGGVAVVTLALPLLRSRFRPNPGMRQHLWISIVFCLVTAAGLALIAASTDSAARALLWLAAAGFIGMGFTGIAMDFHLRRKQGP